TLLASDLGLVVPHRPLLAPGAGALEPLEVPRREERRLAEVAEPRPALGQERLDLPGEARAVTAEVVDEQQGRFPEPQVFGGDGALYGPHRRGLVVRNDRAREPL